MKYILPGLGIVAASALFAFSATNQRAVAVEKSQHERTFEQLDLFADVMARVRNDYVVPVENDDLIDDALNGMLQGLDPHSSYITPEEFQNFMVNTTGEYGGLGMEVTMEEGVVKVIAPFDDTPAARAGIKSGDYLTAIDGESILGLSLSDAVDRMRGKPGEAITVTVIRKGEDPKDIEMVREVVSKPVVTHEVKDGIAYMRIGQFNELTSSSMETSIAALKKEMNNKIPGLILDLRGNPGGLVQQAVLVSSAFLDGGEVVSTRGRNPVDNTHLNAQQGEKFKNIPIIILIDGGSASASEIVAGALQDRDRALLLGMPSFGKGLVQTVIPLRDGRQGALRMTTSKYYTPDGRSIQGLGLTPDIAVSYGHDDGKGNKGGIKEKDLPNAIKNENTSADDEKKEETAEIIIDFPPESFDVKDDYQVKKAIEILKDGSYSKLMTAVKG